MLTTSKNCGGRHSVLLRCRSSAMTQPSNSNFFLKMWTSIDLAEKKVSCCNTQQPSKSRNKTFHWKWTCRRRTYYDLNLARSCFWKLEANCKRISTCGQNLVQLGCVEEVLIRAWWEKTFRRQKMLQYEVSTKTHSKKKTHRHQAHVFHSSYSAILSSYDESTAVLYYTNLSKRNHWN